MDAQEILKSLSNLEQKLQSIESARQQVERTVNAYEGAKAQLSVLTQDFKDIYKQLDEILQGIQSSKDVVSSEVSGKADVVFKSLKLRSDSLEQATNSIKLDFITACNTANENFTKALEKSEKNFSSELGTNINKVREETVKEIQKASSIVSGFNTAVSRIQDDYNKALSTSAENQKTLLTQITTEFSKSVEQYIGSMREVKGEMESILDRYGSLSTQIEDKLSEVKTSIESSIIRLGKDVETSKKAIIEQGQKTGDRIDEGVAKILDANYKSHKLIIILVIGIAISILLNVLSIAKVI